MRRDDARAPDSAHRAHPLRAWPAAAVGHARVAWAVAAASAALAAAVAWLVVVAADGSGSGAVAAAAVLAATLTALPLGWLLLRVARRGERQAALQLAGSIDDTTGVASRSAFLLLAEREFARSRRYGIGAGLLLVDIDRFRRLVDEHGGEAGDRMLREVAASIQATLRGADALARFGPAQVAVFLAHADPLGALDVAERIRERIELLVVPWPTNALRSTVSVGAVMMRPAHLTLQSVVEDAEAALGAARHAGGNCVRAAPVDTRRTAAGTHGQALDGNQAAGS